jgi:hypothetical protein
LQAIPKGQNPRHRLQAGSYNRLSLLKSISAADMLNPKPISHLDRIMPMRKYHFKTAMLLSLAALLSGVGPLVAVETERFDSSKFPPRLKRADSFLGVHFDFHAGPDCTEIGRNTTRAMVENIIDQVHPDYLQIDCKGHRGLSSYPTAVGNPAPGFVGDPLRLWRQVTAERGVSLYLHYSGVWDSEAIIRHPSWAAIDAEGKASPNATSFFSAYADELLIPQLRELAGVYGADGAWIDGECWAAIADYGDAALRAFRDTTGIQSVPRKSGEPHWFEFLQFQRDLFRQYLRRYIAAVKQTNPSFELCSNWAYTDHMAEPVSAPLDFLSGDYSPGDSVNSARLSGRYLVRQGTPWDLMAWSFTRKTDKQDWRQKTAVQLQREAAVVVALGGGFQAYFRQKRDGSVYDEQMPIMAAVAKFCRERQAICHRAEPVPQIALLLSTAGHYRRINRLYNRDLSRVSGTLQALLEGQQAVDVVGEHQLAGRMAEYPLIIVPEWEYVEPAFKRDLVAYARAGGNLLLIGPATAALFTTELGVALEGKPANPPMHLGHGGARAPTKGLTQVATLSSAARPFGTLQASLAPDSPPQPAASIAPLGQGKIAALYFSLGQSYPVTRDHVLRQFANDLVRELFPHPMVEVTGDAHVDVSVARNHGKFLVNLVNTSGPHQSEPIQESIAPLAPLRLKIRAPKRPAKITLEPGAQSLAFEYRDGAATLLVPPVEIHRVVVIEGW